jgi:rhodanese-related sulfurtransferase
MLTRRLVLLLPLAAVSAGLGYTLFKPALAGPTLDAQTAFQRAETGEIVLVDIRQPEEWNETGSPKGAHRLDMRRPDFLAALSVLVDGDHNRQIALICARGGRSARMAKALSDTGFSQVIDVSEGMLGSSAGPGWIARGLPVVTD